MYDTHYHSECFADGRSRSGSEGSYHDVDTFRKELGSSNYITSYVTDSATLNNNFGYFLKIDNHECDLLKPHTLCITCSPDQLKLFDELIINHEGKINHGSKIDLPFADDSLGTTCISKISFSLLRLTRLLKVDDNMYYFDISHLPYLKLAKNIYSINLTMISTSDSMLPTIPITFVNEYLYVEVGLRDKLIKYPIVRVPGSVTQNNFYELGIWQPKIKLPNNKSKTLRVNITKYCDDVAMKGLYIIDNNIDNIEKITITTNSVDIKCFNKFVINSICQTFDHSGSKILYVPFNAHVKHNDMSVETFFNNVIHNAELECVMLTIEYKSIPPVHPLHIIPNGGKVMKIINYCARYSQSTNMSRQRNESNLFLI
jgi:hypothetical protein